MDQVSTRNAVGAAFPSPPPSYSSARRPTPLQLQPLTAHEVVISRSQRCCMHGGATSEVKWVHRISFAILIAHCILVLNIFTYAWWDDLWGTLSVVQVFAYFIGIISSIFVLCDTSKLSHRVCSVLYVVVGILDAVILLVGFFSTYFIRKNMDLFIAVGSIFCFAGATMASKAVRNWDRNRGGAPVAGAQAV